MYEILNGASNKGQDKLYDSKGYAYTLRKENQSGSKLWRCHVCTKANLCHATILESATGEFQRELREHDHSPSHGALADAKIAKRAKVEAAKCIFDPAPGIVEEAIQELLPISEPCDTECEMAPENSCENLHCVISPQPPSHTLSIVWSRNLNRIRR